MRTNQVNAAVVVQHVEMGFSQSIILTDWGPSTCLKQHHQRSKFNLTRKHSNRMRTDRAVTVTVTEKQARMSSDQVGMRPIVDRITDACENITFPCGQ